jgi:hypothetical protein
VVRVASTVGVAELFDMEGDAHVDIPAILRESVPSLGGRLDDLIKKFDGRSKQGVDFQVQVALCHSPTFEVGGGSGGPELVEPVVLGSSLIWVALPLTTLSTGICDEAKEASGARRCRSGRGDSHQSSA